MISMTRRFGLALALAAAPAVFAGDDDPKGKPKQEGKGKRDPAAMFDRLDKNGDGKISKDELEAAPERIREMIARADANHDGVITKEEFLAAGPGRFGKGKKGEGKGEPPKGEPGKGPPPGEGGKKDRGMPDPARIMKRLDKNGDGKISKDEAQGLLANFFDRIDSNNDGFITEAELRASQQKMEGFRDKAGKKGLGKGDRKKPGGELPNGGKDAADKKPGDGNSKDPKGPPAGGPPDLGLMFQRLDANGDGKISRDEARGPLADQFDRYDLNKDGFITKDEMTEIGKRMTGEKRPPGPMGGPGFGFGQPSLVNLFNQQDVDADGRVSRAEAKGKLLEHFDFLDADKDGKLTRQEVEAGMKKLEAKKDASKPEPPKK